jgi:cell division septum initiation protein DivIVA
LHADIANSAVKEAARYMTEGEYSEFVDLVKERLNRFEA